MSKTADDIKRAENTSLVSLGQAGYIIKNKSGGMIVIDPYLSDGVERAEGHMGYKRLLPKLLLPGEILFDAVIATHQHQDHFDADSMPELLLSSKTHLFASTDCCQLVRQCGIRESKVTYVRPGDFVSAGGFQIYFVGCDHGKSAPGAVGVVIEADGRYIYETGDTGFRPEFIDEVKRIGRTDILIAPINGAYGNLNEEECAELSRMIKPKITIPCHYGMFASHGGNPGKFYSMMKEKYPENKVYLMRQGEILSI